MTLTQKRTCRGCRAWHYWSGGEFCDLGYLVEGMAPMEPCEKPRSGKEWALLLMKKMHEGKVPSVPMPIFVDPVREEAVINEARPGQSFDAFVQHMSDLIEREFGKMVPLDLLRRGPS